MFGKVDELKTTQQPESRIHRMLSKNPEKSFGVGRTNLRWWGAKVTKTFSHHGVVISLMTSLALQRLKPMNLCAEHLTLACYTSILSSVGCKQEVCIQVPPKHIFFS